METYYHHFEIEIYSFLDASEILLSFLKNISFMVFGILFLLAMNVLPPFFTSQINFTKVQDFARATERRKIFFNALGIIFSLSIIGFTTYSIIAMFLKGGIITVHIFILLAFAIVSFLLYRYLPIGLKMSTFKVDLYTAKVVLTILIVCAFNYLSAILAANQVSRRTYDEKISFVVSNVHITNNDSILFVGLTSKYVFLKNTKTGLNHVYRKDDIRDLTIWTSNKLKKSTAD